MTWRTWNSVEADGTGTERLVDCTPDCATGKSYSVPVTVRLSHPVKVCVGGSGRWLWTRLAFTWPHGLPAVFHGDNAPLNPFNYEEIASQSTGSCQR
jgi:hypothetical protein